MFTFARSKKINGEEGWLAKTIVYCLNLCRKLIPNIIIFFFCWQLYQKITCMLFQMQLNYDLSALPHVSQIFLKRAKNPDISATFVR